MTAVLSSSSVPILSGQPFHGVPDLSPSGVAFDVQTENEAVHPMAVSFAFIQRHDNPIIVLAWHTFPKFHTFIESEVQTRTLQELYTSERPIYSSVIAFYFRQTA